MPFPPSAACRFFDLPPVNLQNLPLHLTKNSFASAPTHLCGIAYSFLSNGLILRRWAYPQSCALRMTVPSAEEAEGGHVCGRGGFRACGHDQRTEPVWRLCDRPLETFARPLPVIGRYPTLAGRGGSVSRRDHNQAYRRPRPPLRRNQIRRTPHLKRQPLFGRGGLGERRFSQRSGLSPRVSRPARPRRRCQPP